MGFSNRRMKREAVTIEVMIRLACRDLHGSGPSLCPDCEGLLSYALDRIERCPFKERKPACSSCTVHCYRPDMREKIREVMRHSGPRMIFRHPVLAVFHLMDVKRRPE